MHLIRMFMVCGLSMGLLAACDELVTTDRVDAPAAKEPAVEVVERSKRSLSLESYYADVERNLLVQGLLRKDGGGVDTPFSKRDLVENFIRTAAFNEYTLTSTSVLRTPSERLIQRWVKPIVFSLDFGQSVEPEKRSTYTRLTNRYVRRLSRITEHPMSVAASGGNFTIAVLSVDELEAYTPRLRELIPELSPAFAGQITRLDRPDHCIVYTFSDADDPIETEAAVAIIRAEHPPLMGEKCLHEELAQGLGLSNDSPSARPSIFNDDDEFGYLTRHDELLLQILYDDRMPLGATAAQARPVAEVIAAELLGGES